MMKMYKKAFHLLMVLVLLVSFCGQAFAQGDTGSAEGDVALEDKNLYKDHPLYIDLNLDPANDFDDQNFVVMQEGSVILYASSGMSLDVSEDKSVYTLYNPSGEAKNITPGTPVAYIDPGSLQAHIFMPTQVTVQSDRIVFACDPESMTVEQMLYKVGISGSKTFHFSQNLSFSNPAGTLKFDGLLDGTFFVKVSYNGISVGVETWVAYDLKDAVLDISDNFTQEIPIAKIPFSGIPGVGLEVGVGLGLSVEGDTKISFDMKGGKAGFKGSAGIFEKPRFSSLAQQPALEIQEVIAEGAFEVDLTFGPSFDILSLAGAGCDIAAGIAVAAEMTGDEGGRPVDPMEDVNVRPLNIYNWHVCKELSCVQGEIDVLAKLEAWLQMAGHVWSVDYDLFREKYSDFHYSFTFDEFALEPCKHYLYLVDVLVKDTENKPMKDVEVTYTEVPPYADRRGVDYIKGTTGEDGYVHLYMPEGNVKITATSWQTDPDDPTGTAHVKKTVDYDVISTPQDQETVIQLPLYHYMELVYFDENAKGEPVENMPQPFWIEQDHEGQLPNEAPRREGYQFVQWNTEKDGSGTKYFPGDVIKVEKSNVPLYAIWTQQPVTDFRTITYVANDGVLANNPQIYFRDTDGFILINPWRKDYIFTGWTCPEIGMEDPELQVTVQCTDPVGGSDFINRVYEANWDHIAYNVIWRNWDGSWLDVSRDLYDVLPTYEGPTPVRPSDDNNYYLFAGWTPEIKVVNEDAEYTAVYNAYPLLKLVSSPANQTLRAGQKAVFQTVASGGEGTLTYPWYLIPAGQTGAGTAISGANAATFTVTADYALDGNRYYCVVGDAIGQQVTSNSATLRVVESPLVLLFSPENASLKKGETATFAVGVSGGEGTLTYQWYLIPAGQTGAGTAISGANAATFTVTADYALDGNRYYCVVGDAIGQQVTSNSATLRVVESPLVLLFSPENASLKKGETATFAVGVSGGEGTLTYQWYLIPAGQTGAGAAISGANAATLTVTADYALDGNRYYCVVGDAIGQQVSSDAATLRVVKSPLVLLFSPENASLKKGETASFAVGVSGGEAPLTYQWYLIPAGATGAGTAISGANAATLSVTADYTLDGNRYYCRVEDAVGQQVTSDAAILQVSSPALVLLSSPQNVTRMVGETASFTVSVSGGVQPYAYQWYVIQAVRGGSNLFPSALAETGTPIAGAVADTLTVTAGMQLNGNRYYCAVRDAVGQEVVSDSARLDIVQLAPQTGDQFPLLPLLMLLLGSGAILLSGHVARKKRML